MNLISSMRFVRGSSLVLFATLVASAHLACDYHQGKPVPKVSQDDIFSLPYSSRRLEKVAKTLKRIEFVAYRDSPTLRRVGPICVDDEPTISEFRKLMAELKLEENDAPHAQFMTENEVFITFVFSEMSQVRGRFIGQALICFDDERSIGSFPTGAFGIMINRLIDKHSQEHPENVLYSVVR